MSGPQLTAETQRRLDALFTGASREKAVSLLVEECGANLPFLETATPKALERIRFAALKLSGGDLAKLREAVQLAQQDWRDVLVAAGFGEDIQAHEAWFPDDHAV